LRALAAVVLGASAAACSWPDDLRSQDDTAATQVDIEPLQASGPTVYEVNVHAAPGAWCLGLFAAGSTITSVVSLESPMATACTTIRVGDDGAGNFPLQITASSTNPVLFAGVAWGACPGDVASPADAGEAGASNEAGAGDAAAGPTNAGTADASSGVVAPPGLATLCGVPSFCAYGVWPPNAPILFSDGGVVEAGPASDAQTGAPEAGADAAEDAPAESGPDATNEAGANDAGGDP
jgi:hypothetical protein